MAKGNVAINVERCKGCAFCVEFCPTKVLALSSTFNSRGYHPPHVIALEKCSGCDLCGGGLLRSQNGVAFRSAASRRSLRSDSVRGLVFWHYAMDGNCEHGRSGASVHTPPISHGSFRRSGQHKSVG
ncbi:MAG: ferredoxin family protein [Bryobacteraceae bacterium]